MMIYLKKLKSDKENLWLGDCGFEYVVSRAAKSQLTGDQDIVDTSERTTSDPTIEQPPQLSTSIYIREKTQYSDKMLRKSSMTNYSWALW